jgi:hypothetical protein
LTLFSRAGISRKAADLSVENLEIHELPAARGCTYVLPSSDFALGLAVGRSFGGAEMKVAYKLGVTDKEIAKLCDAVVKALGKEPLEPNEIREATGSASRSLGEDGKKKGISTTLPLALGQLQAMGEIRRVSVNGRLDQQRYRYALWRPNPLAGFKLSAEQAAVELARRYFSWIGPAALSEFQTFSGLGVKAVKAAVEPLKLESLAGDKERWMLPGDRAALESFKVPKDPQYVLVSGLDAILLLHVDEASFPHHAILDRGRLIGSWDYDPASGSIVWSASIKKNKNLEKAIARTEAFVREQLGDAPMGALDSPKSRAPRLSALRKAALRKAAAE